MNIYAMIPARYGSKRLKNKNIHDFLGKPMIFYAINACLKSNLISRVFVSTESKIISEIASNYGAEILFRPEELAQDNVPTQEVMKHFLKNFPELDILVVVQANSPNVKSKKINEAVQKLIDNNLREVRTVDSNGLENGAIWVASRNAIEWNGLSVYFGVINDDSIDIHTIEDLKQAEKKELSDNLLNS